jgi:hypothetical protein
VTAKINSTVSWDKGQMDTFDELDIHSAAVQPGESSGEFGARAARILHKAMGLSREISGNYSELNKWVVVAERTGLSVVGAWAYAILRMKETMGAV